MYIYIYTHNNIHLTIVSGYDSVLQSMIINPLNHYFCGLTPMETPKKTRCRSSVCRPTKTKMEMIKATSGSKIRGFDEHPWKMMDRQCDFWVPFFPTSTECRLNMREKQMQRSRFVYSRKLYIARLSLRALQNRRWSDWV